MKIPSYKIEEIDQIDPFLMSITSSDNHWMFISSNGALTAGREKADHALFPYVTDNLIHTSLHTTGPFTVLKMKPKKNQSANTWKPLSYLPMKNSGQRNLYKDAIGDNIVFEEVNQSLGLTFRYQWLASKEFGFIRRAEIINTSDKEVELDITDGLQNILPSGLDVQTQQTLSNLSNAYKHSEIIKKSNMAIFSLGSLIMDRPDPGEALTANVVWCKSELDFACSLVLPYNNNASDKNMFDLVHHLTGAPGSYFVNSKKSLGAKQTVSWDIILDVNLDHRAIVSLDKLIPTIKNEIDESVDQNNRSLYKYIGSADGFQSTSSQNNNMHHTANVLFNIMRGGIFADSYKINKSDFIDFLKIRNKYIFEKLKNNLIELSENSELKSVIRLGRESKDISFLRLCYEYLPLTFGRRHGDPSRPWNQFNIKVSKGDSGALYHHEGNWRDIFQNWEGLSISYPSALESMICKFLNACTRDGYNPYRINRDGIDWEVIDPDDTWSHIGYWNDHQIIYLLKLLEAQWNHNSGFLIDHLNKKMFSSANIPYKIKDAEKIINNPKETIDFDHQLHNKIMGKICDIGSDARLVLEKNNVVHISLTEKLLILALAKVSNFIPDGGIWMNTQRPEWNDANNALVGYGVSMVTLYYLNRYLMFLNRLLMSTDLKEINISKEVYSWFENLEAVCQKNKFYVDDQTTDPKRRKYFVEELQNGFSDYRKSTYDKDSKGDTILSVNRIIAFNKFVLECFKKSIMNNKHNNLYNAYNTINTQTGKSLEVTGLFPMLEGQVAALSSGGIWPVEALQVLESLYDSEIYQQEQNSFMLYPIKSLKPFMDKNIIPNHIIDSSVLLKKLISENNTNIIYRDDHNTYRFNSALINSASLESALSVLSEDIMWSKLVLSEKKLLINQYIKIFEHQNYTGRSGSMYAYEGIGSIYWHMVSKLLLATQEMFYHAIESKEERVIIKNLGKMYYKIRSGLSADKTPQEYGAFPYDPYSHTPLNKGAQQPGMTGQVKEELITRMGELGCHVQSGRLVFNISLLKKSEFLTKENTFTYVDVEQTVQSMIIDKNQLGFTYCQVPIVYSLCDQDWKQSILFKNNTTKEYDGNIVKQNISSDIFSRSGEIKKITVGCPRSEFLF